MKLKLLPPYDSLGKIERFLKTRTNLQCSIQLDQWPDEGELMLNTAKQCLVIKKNGWIGAKIVLKTPTIVDVKPIAPNTFVNTLTQKGIFAFFVRSVISGPQYRVAHQIENYLVEIQNQ